MRDFAYHRPATLDEARRRFAEAADPAYLAGGMTLIPTLKLRLAQPSDVINLSGIPGLSGIALDGGAIAVGGLARHALVAAHPDVRARLPALAALAGHIGDPQVRHRGTIGGSLANNDPAADYPAACLALGATIVTDRRRIAAADFFAGLFSTALEPGEIVVQVRFPVPEAAAYAKFPSPASRYAMVGVFVVRAREGVRVAVTGAGQDGVFRSADHETALARAFSPRAAAGVAVAPDGLLSDVHGAADYRAHLISVMAGRAVAACA